MMWCCSMKHIMRLKVDVMGSAEFRLKSIVGVVRAKALC